jgi:hypothetical protein
MSRPDEGLIHQWLDGECTPEEVARLEQLVATDPEWAAAVAEARGLIAASSRIVQSLDAVPRAMPSGSKAAPATVPTSVPATRLDSSALRGVRAFTVKPWMRAAAGLVLVAGTAYVLRESTTEPFVPTATVDAPASPPATPVPNEVPTDVPPLGPIATADRAVGEQSRGATQGASSPVLLPQTGAGQPARATAIVSAPAAPPPPRTVVTAPARAAEKILDSPNSISIPPDVERARREAEARSQREADAATRSTADTTTTRRAALSAENSRGTVARSAAAPAGAPAAAPAASAPVTIRVLDGCWRITAPTELVADPALLSLRRQLGDTLVISTRIGDVRAIRDGDTLRGGLEAKRQNCPTRP